jgi:hypothetical protein
VRRLLTVVLLAGAAALVPAAPAPAQTAPAGTALGVSVPPDPVRAVPGERAEFPLRVTNPSRRPVSVRFQQRALALGDNGRVEFLDGPDPRWASHLGLPAEPVEIPAGGYREFAFPLDTPRLAPDTYLVGVLVSPVVTAPGVQVVSAAGAFVAVDLPGLRDRRLEATLRAPGLVWGAAADVSLTVRNTGDGALYFWGEHGRTRYERSFLPSGTDRSRPVSVSRRFGRGVERVSVRIFDNRSDAEVAQAIVTRSVVFVHPAYPVAVAVLLVAVPLAWRLRRRHRRLRAARLAPAC